jgi:hypothetical protein
MGHDISKQVADTLAEGNVTIKPPASFKDLLERAFLKKIASNSLQWFTGIKDIPVGIHSGKHCGIAVERLKFQHCPQ